MLEFSTNCTANPVKIITLAEWFCTQLLVIRYTLTCTTNFSFLPFISSFFSFLFHFHLFLYNLSLHSKMVNNAAFEQSAATAGMTSHPFVVSAKVPPIETINRR